MAFFRSEAEFQFTLPCRERHTTGVPEAKGFVSIHAPV